MKIVGFIGGYDKTDLILYISKMLSIAGKKVLMIDGTLENKSKYIIPNISPTFSYVTNYEKIDIAVGFDNYQDIAKYLMKTKLDYDYILIDVDNYNSFYKFQLYQAAKNYFVTSFSLYSIRKGLSVIRQMPQPINLERIFFAKEISQDDNNYLDYLALGCKVIWDKNRVYFPLDSGDQTAIIENEKLSRIRFKNLTSQYRDGLIYITEELLENDEIKAFEKALREFEK